MIYTDDFTLDEITDVVSEYFKLTPYQIFKTSRRKNIIAARQVFCYLSCENTNKTLQDIAEFITKKGHRENTFDHATVIYSREKIRAYIHQYLKDYNTIKTLEFNIKNKLKSSIIVSDVNLLVSIKNQK